MAGDAPQILVIEDEAAIRRFLRVALTDHGYRFIEADSGERGLLQASTQPPDVVILDLGLPDMDGTEVTRRLRSWSRVPIVVLSARGREEDKIKALDAGADDYLTKPFGIGELLARLRVALRHRREETNVEQDVVVGDLKVDLAARVVTVRGREIRLTPIEYRLLALLASAAGRVLTHGYMLKEVWGPHATQDVAYLRVFMSSLRRKVEVDPARPRYLLTDQGVGYRLAES